MRIIAGQYRSRPLRALPGSDTRPTSDRLRETLFNVLAAARTLEGTVWWDLFAGTGAVGLEALSRGAAMVYFIEQSRTAVQVIRCNLQSLGIKQGGLIIERGAAAAVHQLDQPPDFVFLDPPYRLHEAYRELLDLLGASSLLKPETIVIAEHDKRHDPGESHGRLERYRLLKQGDAALSFYAVEQP